MLWIPTAWAFTPPDVPPATLQALSADGPVVVRSGRDTAAAAWTPVSCEVAWDTVTAWEDHPSWMPQVTQVRELSRDGEARELEWTLDFTFSVVSKSVTYTSRSVEDREKLRVEQVGTGGDFANSSNSWVFQPAGTGCVVWYATWTDLQSMGWLASALLEDQPAMEQAIQTSTVSLAIEALVEKLGH